tara:strand:+ start:546 stop:851 length:306 start_codon:yes stop_codon:yes gene_type:complete
MASEIHVDDVGTRFLITVQDDGVAVDISSAVSRHIKLKKPSSTVLDRTGTLYTDGTDGKMYYDAVAGDLDEAGDYKIQGKVIFSAGTFSTDVKKFKVHCNI